MVRLKYIIPQRNYDGIMAINKMAPSKITLRKKDTQYKNIQQHTLLYSHNPLPLKVIKKLTMRQIVQLGLLLLSGQAVTYFLFD